MSETKKISLADLVKQKLANQKAGNGSSKQGNVIVKKTKPMVHQLAKKPNNQKKRTGV